MAVSDRPAKMMAAPGARWVSVAAGFILLGLSGVIWNSFSLFLVALEAEFGWGRGAISLGFSLFAAVSALSAPLIGVLFTRYDSHLILVGLSVLFGLGLIGCSLTGSLISFYLLFGLVCGLGAQCTSSFALFTVLASHFPERPAAAMAIADSGSGIGVFIGLPLVQWLIGTEGWRDAYVVLGAVVLILAVPLHLFALGRAERSPPPATGGTVRSPMRPPLLMMGMSFVLGALSFQALQTQQVALFNDAGIPAETAVWIASTAGLSIFVTRFFSGWLADRYGEMPVMRIAMVTAAGAVTLLLIFSFVRMPALLTVYPVLVGLGFGAQAILLASGTRRLIDGASFGVVFGTLRLGTGAGMAFGPFIAGYIHDQTGSYGLALAVILVSVVGHFLLFRQALRFRRIDV